MKTDLFTFADMDIYLLINIFIVFAIQMRMPFSIKCTFNGESAVAVVCAFLLRELVSKRRALSKVVCPKTFDQPIFRGDLLV